mmetsp:Transcript_12614/g.33960  ORF Transcript_12614/g.33960 Transcript_12614/m.33960 type:complete len:340 (-) Transcript_12614:105-1124(-)
MAGNKAADVILEKLVEGAEVTFRSSEALQKLSGRLRYDVPSKTFLVELKEKVEKGREKGKDAQGDHPGEEPVRITLKEITQVKGKDYQQGHATQSAMVIVAGTVQYCMIFGAKEVRDTWVRQLEDLCRQREASTKTKGGLVQGLEGHYWSVQLVELLDPLEAGKDLAVVLKLTLFHPLEMAKVEHLFFRKGMSVQACKDMIADFQNVQGILATEGSSLYRMTKSLLMRDRTKDDVLSILERIEGLHIDRVAKSSGRDPETLDVGDIESLRRQTASELEALKKSMPDRIGDGGVGPTILGTILNRNIDKLTIINDTTAKMRIDIHQRNQTARSSQRSSAR